MVTHGHVRAHSRRYVRRSYARRVEESNSYQIKNKRVKIPFYGRAAPSFVYNEKPMGPELRLDVRPDMET